MQNRRGAKTGGPPTPAATNRQIVPLTIPELFIEIKAVGTILASGSFEPQARRFIAAAVTDIGSGLRLIMQQSRIIAP
jgi:hypothetical protein